MTTENDEGKSDNEGQKFVPPKDGSWLPRERVNEMVGEAKDLAREARAELEREREARIKLEAKLEQGNTQEKVYTRAELNALVKDEKISSDQADTIWEKQLEEKFERRLDEKLNAALNSSNAETRVTTELNQYRELVDDLDKVGSENRNKVEQEYRYLVGIGQPYSVATELAAVRTVFGPVEKLRKAKASLSMESHQETGGGKTGTGKTPEFQDTLTARRKEHYQKMIDDGMYKNWDEVKEELKYADPKVMRAHGEKV